MSVHIRQVGDWTRALGKRVGAAVDSTSSDAMKGHERNENLHGGHDFIGLDPSCASVPLPEVRIDGPYGAPAADVFKAEVAVLVGMGIGKCVAPYCVITDKETHRINLCS